MIQRLLLVAALLATSPALAQQPGQRPILPNLLTPAEPSRPAAGPASVRLVTLSQLDPDGERLGERITLRCPQAGCQEELVLTVDGRPERFGVTVTLVACGLYLTLEARSVGTARIVTYETGSAGPAFVPFRGAEPITRQLRYLIARDASTRNAARAPGARRDPKTYADGNVFTRRLEWDVTLQVDITQGAPDGG